MNNKTKLKMMAVLAVLAMMMVCIVPVNDSENGLDAAVGDGGAYSYTITYDSSQMSTTSAAISVANMTAISHTGSPTAVASLNAGSWTWDTTTGRGPFNSFYAAFDINNGNAYYAVLNPFNLTKTITGEDLPTPLTRWNIMWVLPTVYIKSTADSLTLTNDSTAGGTAYAHTIDGHVYKYVAIGVYEGSTTTLDGQTVLTSTTGTMPAANATRAVFRGYAHNYAMSPTLNESSTYPAHSMLWNFDQWTLFKDICFATMEDFNSENHVGNGHVFTNNSTYSYETGALNTRGPYAGLPARITDDATALSYGSDSVKLYIENAWGGVWDFVDGAVFDGRTGIYLDNSSNPTDAHTGTYVAYHTWPTAIQNGYPISIQTDNARIWGFQGSTVGGSDTTGTADYIWTSADADRVLRVGGDAWSAWSGSVRCGLSSSYVNNALSSSAVDIGSRLAFVFDAGPASTVTATVDPSGYGTLSNGTQSGQSNIAVAGVPYASNVTVSGNTLTANGITLTATPTAATAQYTYTFDGWYQGNTKITSSMMILKDTAITAKFVRSVNNYTVSVGASPVGYGTVSSASVANVPYGSTITVSNNTISVNGTTVTATPATDTAEWDYSFVSWSVANNYQVVGDTSVTATFDREKVKYTVSILSNNIAYGEIVPVGTINDVPYGSVINIDGNDLEVNGTTVTATEKETDVQYTYSFEEYDVQDGDLVTGNLTITATFNATLRTYIVLFTPNESGYGSVSVDKVEDAPYGDEFEVDGDTVTINNVEVQAIPAQATAQYTYAFSSWSVTDGQRVEGDMTVTANFTRTVNTYTVTLAVSPNGYGTVSSNSISDVPYGSKISISNNVLTVNGSSVTATPTSPGTEWTYSFVSWSVQDNTDVTGNVTVTATFERTPTPYDVTFEVSPSGYGSVDKVTVKDVPYGSAFTVSNNEITINNVTVTATPARATVQYTYAFDSWSVEDGDTITGETEVTASFTRTVNTYPVTITVNNPDYGSVSPTSIMNVPYGTEITVSDNTLTIGLTTVTATAAPGDEQASHVFDEWKLNGRDIRDGATTTNNNTITAMFKGIPTPYTITWVIEGQEDDTTSVGYGEMPTHDAPTREHYRFVGWEPKLVPVTGEATYTAKWTPLKYTVKWDANGGYVYPKSTTGTVETAVNVPTPTRDYYTFDGWFTQQDGGTEIVTPYMPESNVTFYAHWTAITYTVSFDAGEGSSVSDETGSQVLPISLPNTTLADKYFAGWYTASEGGELIGYYQALYYPAGDVTLYAHWSDTAIYTYVLNYDANGGYNAPSPMMEASDESGTYDFRIKDYNVKKAGQYFIGWATTDDATEAEYESGDTVTVQADTPVTLYAVWSDEKPVKEFDWLFKAIAIISGVGILLGSVALLVRSTNLGKDMVKSIIAVTLASLIYVAVMLPVFGLI